MEIYIRIVLSFVISLGVSLPAFSQSCNGTSSGGQNLVTNGDFSTLYAGWSHSSSYTTYTPCQGCNSVAGNIYAGSDPQNFNDAFANIQDHSASDDNNFLMVNQVCQPGIKLWSQSNIQILPNATYYFSVWITSLTPSDITESGELNFNINGLRLPAKITAPGVVGQWVRFYASYNSGSNPPSTITIDLQNTMSITCDHTVNFAIDDISFVSGCDNSITGPQPDLGADITLCGKTLPLTINPGFNSAAAASNQVTYTWYKDAVMQIRGTGASFYNFNVTGPGTYSVCVDSAGSCPKSDAFIVQDAEADPECNGSVNSVFSKKHNKSISVFPNPAAEVVTISYPGDFQFEIMNTKGQVLQTGSGAGTAQVNVQRYEHGAYIVRISTPEQTASSSFIVP